MSAAERISTLDERRSGSGRQPASTEAVREANLEVRAARLDCISLANELRSIGRSTQYLGHRDGIPEVVQLGMAIEAKGERLLRQWAER